MFTWILAYKQITERLLQFENRQQELIQLLEEIGITNFTDQDADGKAIKLDNIDPLTFICYLNKYGDEKRVRILQSLCKRWNIEPFPNDVNGLPNVNAQRVWMFPYKNLRVNNEIERLWLFFKVIMENTITNELFQDALRIHGVGKSKLSEVMFMVMPDRYLCVNGAVKKYLQEHNLPNEFNSFEDYLSIINKAKDSLNKGFEVISYDAFDNKSKTFDTEVAEDNVNYNQKDDVAMDPSLNTILYGPPGTGKTYHTISKAVQIINPEFFEKSQTRVEVKEEYKRLKNEGQIEFIAFHQSMSYEDFIEGIKPKKPEEGDEYLQYVIEEGLFKKISKRADYTPTPQAEVFTLTENEFTKASFYKLSLGNTALADDEQIYRYCIENGYIALGWGGANDFSFKGEHEIQLMVPSVLAKYEAQAVNYFTHYLKKDDYVVVSYGNLRLRAIGKVTGDYEYRNVNGLEVKQFRKVKWLLADVDIPVEELYNKQFSQQTIYKLNKSEIRKDFFIKAQTIGHDDTLNKNYVLIIDEINRGNIAQIFGELITLIEPDKRRGASESLELMLPYSKESFSVPSNLYIIGTMNTADRSVEALDTALRRRFTFEAMMPKPELLQHQNVPGVDLVEMLQTINHRLEVLLTKDHTIGHAWLMDVNSLTQLQAVFKNKILPLLEEYFYNNYAKIGLVLGAAFVQQKPVKAIFAKNFKDAQEIGTDYEGNTIYYLLDPAELTVDDFTSIYL